MPAVSTPTIYSVTDFARTVLKVAPVTVRRLLRDGQLTCRRIGRRVILTDADAAAYLAANPAKPWKPEGPAGPGRPPKNGKKASSRGQH